MTKRGLLIGALALAVVTATTTAYAGSALQLYAGTDLRYVKHVNFNTASGANTTLLLKNEASEVLVQVRVGAQATDGTTLWQTRSICLRPLETRSLVFVWSKNITDLNFIQLIRVTAPNAHH